MIVNLLVMQLAAEMNLLVVEVKRHRMSSEVLCSRLQAEFLVDSFHTVLIQVDT